jgi:hypothetical protein
MAWTLLGRVLSSCMSSPHMLFTKVRFGPHSTTTEIPGHQEQGLGSDAVVAEVGLSHPSQGCGSVTQQNVFRSCLIQLSSPPYFAGHLQALNAKGIHRSSRIIASRISRTHLHLQWAGTCSLWGARLALMLRGGIW